MNEKNFLDLIGASTIEESYVKRQADPQTKMFSIRKPQLVQMTADECKGYCDAAGVVYVPGYEHRVMDYTVSNECKDRYGDIVRAAGARFENYVKNPVMFFSHDYSQPPIGNSIKSWIDLQEKQVRSWGLFTDDSVDKTGFADLIFRFAQSGFMRACSVGFQPLKANRPSSEKEAEAMGLGKWGLEHVLWDMLEWSPCGVPANPQALQNSLKEIGNRLELDKHHIEAAAKFKLFADDNLLDRFVESIKPEHKLFDFTLQSKEVAPELMLDKMLEQLVSGGIIAESVPAEKEGVADVVLREQARTVILGQLTNGGTMFVPPEVATQMIEEMPKMVEEKIIELVDGYYRIVKEADPILPPNEEPEPPETPTDMRKELYVSKIGELWDDTSVYIVDGEDVREHVSASFFGGGHGYCDDTAFVPKNEIWIEELECAKEMQMALVHKVLEYTLQKYMKLDDMTAHLQTLSAEYVIRKIALWVMEEEEDDESKGVEDTLRALVEATKLNKGTKGLYDAPAEVSLFSPLNFTL